MRLEPIEVRFSNEVPSFVRSCRRRGVKGLGLAYEAWAHRALQVRCEASVRTLEYIPSPWFKYRASDAPLRWNFAQPDGLILAPNEGLVYIVEIKLRHTAESYFQLLDRYLPLMEKFFSKDWRFCLIEMCKWFDPFTAYPGPVVLRDNPLDARPNELVVHRWKDA